MLNLTSKNYYRIVLTRISWLRNLFCNLTTNYAWNNIVTTKMIKLRKLMTEAMNVETWIQKYRGENRDDNYDVVPMHASYNGQRQWWRWSKLSINKPKPSKLRKLTAIPTFIRKHYRILRCHHHKIFGRAKSSTFAFFHKWLYNCSSKSNPYWCLITRLFPTCLYPKQAWIKWPFSPMFTSG